MKNPTDREVLQSIYDLYIDVFLRGEPPSDRQTKIFVPIDCRKIAAQLGCDGEIVFSRLYYHLSRRYGYLDESGTKHSLFELNLGNERKCINFPYMAAVLADLDEKHKKFWLPLKIAILSLLVSIASIVITIAY